MRERYQKTNPAERQHDILQRLEQSVEAIQDSDTFRHYLDFQSRFHRYSFSNTLLILAQRPDATQVAGFRSWQRMNRFVKKGEKAIKIFVPMTKKQVDAETGEEEKKLFFGIGNVFDVSQTNGEELPRVEVPVLEGNEGLELYNRTKELLEADGLTVEWMPLEEAQRHPNLMGYLRPDEKLVRVRGDVSQRQQTKTILHEAAHYVGGHGSCSGISRDEAETEAESVAYVVAARFGIDTGERSFPYVATWSKDKAVFKAVLGRIQQTSATIIDRLGGTEELFPDTEENAPEEVNPVKSEAPAERSLDLTGEENPSPSYLQFPLL